MLTLQANPTGDPQLTYLKGKLGVNLVPLATSGSHRSLFGILAISASWQRLLDASRNGGHPRFLEDRGADIAGYSVRSIGRM